MSYSIGMPGADGVEELASIVAADMNRQATLVCTEVE